MNGCPYCEDGKATTEIVLEDGDTETVCRPCSRDYGAWLREQESQVAAEGYDGPYFADTMSGGCIYLGG